jgi:hypothetical protein
MLHMGRRERNSYLESQDVFCVLAAFEIFTGHTELPGNDFSYSEWQCVAFQRSRNNWLPWLITQEKKSNRRSTATMARVAGRVTLRKRGCIDQRVHRGHSTLCSLTPSRATRHGSQDAHRKACHAMIYIDVQYTLLYSCCGGHGIHRA